MSQCGIIDIGSNTIRLSIYQYDHESSFLLMNRKTMAGLAGYVYDGILSREGIAVACQTLGEYRTLLKNLEIEEFYAFATASLRNIVNTDEAIQAIERAADIKVRLISGEEEAHLSFCGAMKSVQMTDGLLIDLGGGSTELARFKNGEVQAACSLAFGSLSLYTTVVDRLIPNKKEKKEITAIVAGELQWQAADIGRADHICGAGGTCRAVLKLVNSYYHKPDGNNRFTAEELKKLLHVLMTPDRQCLLLILRTVPDRVHTIIPGMIALHTICKWAEAKDFIISSTGVREGYLYHEVLRR